MATTPLPPRESPRAAEAEARLREQLARREELMRQEATHEPSVEHSIDKRLAQRNTDREVFSALRDTSEAQFDELLDAFAQSKDPRERAAWSYCKWAVGGSGIFGLLLPGAAISAIWRYRRSAYKTPKPSIWARIPLLVVLTPMSFFSILSIGSRACEERVFGLPETSLPRRQLERMRQQEAQVSARLMGPKEDFKLSLPGYKTGTDERLTPEALRNNEELAKQRNPLGGLHKMAVEAGVAPPSAPPSAELQRMEAEFKSFKKEQQAK